VTWDSALWTGLLDIDLSQGVVNIAGRSPSDYQLAYILVRIHNAPIGYITIPAEPVESITERARSYARERLAKALSTHESWHADSWAQLAQVHWLDLACPARGKLRTDGLSVVVCTRNRPALLRACLRSLQRLDHKPLDIVVVDNAPTDDATAEVVGGVSNVDRRVRYVREARAGLSRARNRGLSEALYENVAFTDDDVEVDPLWASAFAAALAGDPDSVCVTGLVTPFSLDTGPERYFDARYQWGEAFEPQLFDLGEHSHESPLYPFRAGLFGTGASFAVRRTAVSELGGFDPRLGAGSSARGGEDLDMFVRIILAGGRITYVPAALAWHKHRADTAGLSDQIFAYGHGLGAYLAKRLMKRDLGPGQLVRAFRDPSKDVERLRAASEAARLGRASALLAVSEALGVATGMARYCVSARASRAQ